jgi:hypothetical protein
MSDSLKFKLILAGAGIVALYLLARAAAKQGGAAAASVVDALNPASANNIVNRAVSAAVGAVSGGKYLSIGDMAYNVFNADDAGKIATATTSPWTAADQEDADADYYMELAQAQTPALTNWNLARQLRRHCFLVRRSP